MTESHVSVTLRIVTLIAMSMGVLCNPALAQVQVKIAHVGPVSGPQAHQGHDNEIGVRMALDELSHQP